jgi:hypothetical protein
MYTPAAGAIHGSHAMQPHAQSIARRGIEGLDRGGVGGFQHHTRHAVAYTCRVLNLHPHAMGHAWDMPWH